MMKTKFLLALCFLATTLVAQNKVGVNTSTPDANLHVRGSSSIPFPNLRITDTVDNFSRIKMETEIAPDRFWDIAASPVEGLGLFNIYFKNDTIADNLFQISDQGVIVNRSLRNDMRTWYYTNQSDFRGAAGFYGPHYSITTIDDQSSIRFATDNTQWMILDSTGRIGLRTLAPESELDIRTTAVDDGSELHLSNGDRSHFLRLFSGRQGFENPVLYWNHGDKFVIGRAEVDESNYQPFLRLDGKRIEVLNTGKSILIGEGTGEKDDLTDNYNIAMGDSAMHNNVVGIQNIAIGANALFSSNGSQNNIAIGHEALYSNTVSSNNTAIGYRALFSNQNFGSNTAIGYATLENNTSSENVAVGARALKDNTTGPGNVAVGDEGLTKNTEGRYNTAVGHNTLLFNTMGDNNTAVGMRSMFRNETGTANTAIGNSALFHSVDKSNIVAIGDSALYLNGNGAVLNTHGAGNTAVGSRAMMSNTVGYQNTALGSEALRKNFNGINNTAVGFQSLFSNQSGLSNTALGYKSMRYNTTGEYNVAVGNEALEANLDGDFNVAVGFASLVSNESGGDNTAVGNFAMAANLSGNDNVAVGGRALSNNTSGWSNTAVGHRALDHNRANGRSTAIGHKAMENADSRTTGRSTYNTAVGYYALSGSASNPLLNTGQYNTAIGDDAMRSTTSGYSNTAIGYETLRLNSSGYENTAVGRQSLRSNTTGNSNTAVGIWSMYDNTSGHSNTAMGRDALTNNTTGYENIGIGRDANSANTTGFANVAVGFSAGTGSATNQNSTFVGHDADYAGALSNVYRSTAVGRNARVTADNQVRLGSTLTTSIGGQVGWTTISDGRYKTGVVANVPGLDFINELRPVTYNLDVSGLRSSLQETVSDREIFRGKQKSEMRISGFIAQEVEAAAADLGFDFSGLDAPKNGGDMYGLRYAEFVVPLVKAVQELSEANTALRSANNDQREEIEMLAKALQSRDEQMTQFKAQLQMLTDKVDQSQSMREQ